MYTKLKSGKYIGANKGFPTTGVGSWCKHLKYDETNIRRHFLSPDEGGAYGFPMRKGNWCTVLKTRATKNLRIPYARRELVYPTQNKIWDSQQGGVSIQRETSRKRFSTKPANDGRDKNVIQILGIAADEPKRIEKHIGKPNVLLPLVEAGWTEAMCRKWCEDNSLLSPTYTTSARGGCWFCHNQGTNQLRLLRRDYPDLWQLLLKWDTDSPVSFRSDGHTVHDYDKRFQMEDDGLIEPDDTKFRWSMLEEEFQLKIHF